MPGPEDSNPAGVNIPPIRTIVPIKMWGSMIKYALMFTLFLAVPILFLATLMLPAVDWLFLMGAAFSLAFGILLLSMYCKKIEYRLYEKELVCYTHLLKDSFVTIPYGRITSIYLDDAKKVIKVYYLDEETSEKLEEGGMPENVKNMVRNTQQSLVIIESGPAQLQEDCRSLLALASKYSKNNLGQNCSPGLSGPV